MVRILLVLSAIASFFIFAAEATAQTVGQAPVQYIISPEIPGPGESVNIEVQGVGNFLGNSNITWTLDGKTVKSGVGARSITFTTGSLGSRTTIGITINSPTEGLITKSFTFQPSTVNMVWEADTSAPPWFKGKSLYSAGSTFTVTAFPQVVSGGKTISKNNLSFQWKQNGTPLPQQSGVGFNQLTLSGSQLLPGETISVTVLLSNSPIAIGSITVPASKPQAVLYVRDPLRGVLYDTALTGSISLTATEFTLRVEPYYFANSSLQNGMVPYSWQLNGEDTTGPETAQGALTLRQSGSGAGRAALTVDIQNTDSDKYVQSASAALTILFGDISSSAFSSFFGL